MPISMKHRTYLSLLIIAGAMLGVDKLFLGGGGPVTAQASEGQGETDGSSAITDTSTGAQGGELAQSASSRVGQLQPGRLAEVLDTFSTPSSENSSVADLFHTNLAPVIEVPIAVQEEPVVTFPALRVTSIMYGTANRSAIINGRVVRIGETIDGVVLTRVEADEIEITMGKNTLTLPVSRDR